MTLPGESVTARYGAGIHGLPSKQMKMTLCLYQDNTTTTSFQGSGNVFIMTSYIYFQETTYKFTMLYHALHINILRNLILLFPDYLVKK